MSGQSGPPNAYDYVSEYTTTSAPYAYSVYQPHFGYAPHSHVPRQHVPVAQQASFSHDLDAESYSQHNLQTRSQHDRLYLEVTSYTLRGSPGTKFYTYFRSYRNLSNPAWRFFVQFYNQRSEATLSQLNPSPDYFQYALTTEIPVLGDQRLDILSLFLNVIDEAGRSLGVFDVGQFSYEVSQQATGGSFQAPPRKRRVTDESMPESFVPAKRASTQHLRNLAEEQAFSEQPMLTQTPEPVSPKPTYGRFGAQTSSPQEARSRAMSPVVHASRQGTTQLTTSGHAEISSRQMGMHQTYPVPVPSSSLPARLPVGVQEDLIESSSFHVRRRHDQTESPSSRPSLIRTSTLFPTTVTNPNTAGSTQGFNPYRMYPNQATLEIQGDLDLMMDDWTDIEKKTKRRLVEFQRSQNDSVITTTFKPVTLEERAPRSICISCIWWEEKQEAFITSVDTITLLESLVSVRFTVEEKNRIRRNLEGFRPLTVAKANPESESFFRLIMTYPNPKPRNIEKDVKVFPWTILPIALKKIISKYSASYASAAGSLQPGGSGSSFSRRAHSPASTSSSVTSVVRSGAPVSTSLSPQSQSLGTSRSISHPVSTEMLPGPVQSQYPIYGPYHAQYQRAPQPHDVPGYAAVPGAWGIGQYVESSPGTALPSSYHLYEQQTELQTQQGSQYPPTGQSYMPYDQHTSHP